MALDVSYLTAAGAGALSFLSPCVLPLVPPYLCYMAGVTVEDFRSDKAAARISPNSRGSFVQLSPLSTERYTCPLTLAAYTSSRSAGWSAKAQIVLLARPGNVARLHVRPPSRETPTTPSLPGGPSPDPRNTTSAIPDC